MVHRLYGAFVPIVIVLEDPLWESGEIGLLAASDSIKRIFVSSGLATTI
jgi:hypothetical protein